MVGGGCLREDPSSVGRPTAPAHTQMNNILLCSWGHIIRCHNKPSRENNGMWENGNIVGGWNDNNNNKPVHTIHPFTRPTNNQLTTLRWTACLPLLLIDACFLSLYQFYVIVSFSLTLSPALPWKLTPNEWKLANERAWPPPLSQLSQSVSRSQV